MEDENLFDDCYNRDKGFIIGDHFGNEEKGYIEILHIAYIYLSNNEQVEIIIRDHDDINNPCFYILTPDRSKELYKVSLFDNSYTEGLNDEDKKILTEFIKWEFRYEWDSTPRICEIFREMKIVWLTLNMPDEDETPYDNIIAPKYI